MLKTLQARFQQYMNWELPDVQAGFRKCRGTRGQRANISWIIEKAREIQKNIYLCFIDITKAFNCEDHNKLWKILKEMGDYLTCLLKNLYAGQEETELDMEQRTGSKLGKKYIKAGYCHLAYLQSTSCKTPGWMNHKLESSLPGEISTTSDMQMIPLSCRKWRGTKEPLDEGERGEWKIWLKTQHLKNEDHGIQCHHFVANRWEKSGNRLNFLGLQNHCHCGQWLQPWY